MEFGILVPNYGKFASREAMARVSTAAEELGYDAIWVAERLLVPIPANQGWSQINPTAYEPLIALSYLAAITRRVKLGTNIVIAPFRNPLVLARQAAALDQLSGGRLILGLGLGWMREEFEAVGIDMNERGRRTDEMIDLLRELWEKEKPSFSGRFTEFPPIQFEPKPLQKKVLIWIGGVGDAALRRVVRCGDGWTPTELNLHELKERIAFLRAEAERRKRPLDEIAVSYGSRFYQRQGGNFGDASDVADLPGTRHQPFSAGLLLPIDR